MAKFSKKSSLKKKPLKKFGKSFKSAKHGKKNTKPNLPNIKRQRRSRRSGRTVFRKLIRAANSASHEKEVKVVIPYEITDLKATLNKILGHTSEIVVGRNVVVKGNKRTLTSKTAEHENELTFKECQSVAVEDKKAVFRQLDGSITAREIEKAIPGIVATVDLNLKDPNRTFLVEFGSSEDARAVLNTEIFLENSVIHARPYYCIKEANTRNEKSQKNGKANKKRGIDDVKGKWKVQKIK